MLQGFCRVSGNHCPFFVFSSNLQKIHLGLDFPGSSPELSDPLASRTHTSWDDNSTNWLVLAEIRKLMLALIKHLLV